MLLAGLWERRLFHFRTTKSCGRCCNFLRRLLAALRCHDVVNLICSFVSLREALASHCAREWIVDAGTHMEFIACAPPEQVRRFVSSREITSFIKRG